MDITVSSCYQPAVMRLYKTKLQPLLPFPSSLFFPSPHPKSCPVQLVPIQSAARPNPRRRPRGPAAAPAPSPAPGSRRGAVPEPRPPPLVAPSPALAASARGARARPVAAPSAGNRRARRVLAAEHAAPQQAWASNGTQPKASSSLGVLRPGWWCEQEQVGSSSWANSV